MPGPARPVTLSALVAAALVAALPAAADDPAFTPLVMRVLADPVAVPGSDGRRHLVYELVLTNVTTGTATVERVEVLDGDRGTTLATLDRAAIPTRLQLGTRQQGVPALGPAQTGLLFLHLALDGPALPRRLGHRVTAAFDIPLPPGSAISRGGPAAVDARPLPVLGPPLAGDGYIAGDGCCDSIRHVRSMLAIDGALHLAQRFAIDWERLFPDGRIVHGDPADVASYRIYGEPVLAVADAVVAAAADGAPDGTPGAFPTLTSLSAADGNHVVLDLGDGRFALYAHLQPGSVAVVAGQHVSRGDVLGRVGNTGNSLEPHLHFHVTDGPSPLASNGLPYVQDCYVVTGRDLAGTADFDRAAAGEAPATITPADPPQPQRGTLPLDLVVVDWRGCE